MSEDRKMTREEKIAFLNQKTEEVVAKQEKELITDYDEALNEYKLKNKSHKIKFKGKVFDVPSSMPFSFGMFYLKHCIQKKNGKTIFSIPDDKLDEFIERMFGKKFLLELNASDDVELKFVIGELVPDIMAKWGYGINKDDNIEKNK